MHLSRSEGAFPSQTKVIHCVFSGSDVGSKWRLLCSLLHPTTKHLNHLGDILVYICSGVKTMVVGLLQLTQGWSKVRRPCQSTIVGAAFIRVTSHRQEAENNLVDFYHRVDVYTHYQHTFMFKQHVKVNLASDDLFKKQSWKCFSLSGLLFNNIFFNIPLLSFSLFTFSATTTKSVWL